MRQRAFLLEPGDELLAVLHIVHHTAEQCVAITFSGFEEITFLTDTHGTLTKLLIALHAKLQLPAALRRVSPHTDTFRQILIVKLQINGVARKGKYRHGIAQIEIDILQFARQGNGLLKRPVRTHAHDV